MWFIAFDWVAHFNTGATCDMQGEEGEKLSQKQKPESALHKELVWFLCCFIMFIKK